ncbi:MAG: GNAT family N-acetyltransferase [Deltaproteobacteria bacterium]|nr:GNAT family N-acetyltransferase [Deltaproteobacteria bacterium]MBI3391281.1 GNAT family N-acetyltransferase [Deltaproteobacteria bacterium]
MNITLREARPEDVEVCGRICYEAFGKINAEHNFPPDFPTPEIASGMLAMMIAHPEIYVVTAERDGRIIGSNAMDERTPIGGIGPISVDPATQNSGVGGQLMRHMLDRAARRKFPGVRLVQAAFHNRSLSLYTKLGFDPREPLSCMQGPPIAATIPGYAVRLATAADLAACTRVCVRVHGHTREGEVRDAIQQGHANVVEHDGRISGYSTGIGFISHAVGESTDDIKALIAAAPTFFGPGVLVPTRNAELLRWCLNHGLRIVQPMTLMSVGLYNEPQGAFLPSIAF